MYAPMELEEVKFGASQALLHGEGQGNQEGQPLLEKDAEPAVQQKTAK